MVDGGGSSPGMVECRARVRGVKGGMSSVAMSISVTEGVV
jgi:hypothetical protein